MQINQLERSMNRRDFLTSTTLAAAAVISGCATPAPADEGRIMTVTGSIRPCDLGRTLVHEHVVHPRQRARRQAGGNDHVRYHRL